MKRKYLFLLFCVLFILGIISCLDRSNSYKPEKYDVKDVNIRYKYALKNRDTINKALPVLDSAIFISKELNNDTLFLKSLSLKSVLYGKSNDLDGALRYADSLLRQADILNNQFYLGKAFYKKGYYNHQKGNLIEAYQNYVESKNIFLRLGDDIEVAKRILNMAIIQKNIGDYMGSEISATDGLGYLTNDNSNKLRFKLYSLISTNCLERLEFAEAIKNRNKSIELLTSNKELTRRDSLDLAMFKNNKALIFLRKGEFLKSKKILEEVLSYEILKDTSYSYERERARIMANLGYSKFMLDEHGGEKMIFESYKLRKKIKDQIGLNSSLNYITRYYRRINQGDSALFWAQRALENGIVINSYIAQNQAIGGVYGICEEHPKLYERIKGKRYYKIYESNDSILQSMETNLRNIYAKDKYNLQLEEFRTLKQRRQKYLFAGIGIVIILFGGVYFHYSNKVKRERFKKDTAREVYNTEIRLSKKVHDELANDMYAVMTQLQHQTNEVALEALLDKLEVIYERSRDISRATGDIDTENFNAVLRQMLDGYTNDHVNVIMNGLVQGFWKDIAPYKKVEIFRVLRELMTNMKKHSKATLVVVRFKKKVKPL